MDERLKQRLVGAVVLVVVAVVFIPMFLEPKSDRVETPVPDAPRVVQRESFNSRIQPLEEDSKATTAPPAPEKSPSTEAEVGSETKTKTKTKTEAKVETETRTTKKAQPNFAVQLGSFSNAKNAQALRDRLVAKGYTAFVTTSTSGARSVTRVYVGPQSSRAEAREVLERLAGEIKLEGIVVNHPG